MTNAVQALGHACDHRRRPVPVAANQEGGLVQGLSGPGFSRSHQPSTRAGRRRRSLRTAATTWARQLGRAGINLDFAPVADVAAPGTDASNAPIGQLHREYGHHPPVVADHVAAFIEGMRAAGVATTAQALPRPRAGTANTDDAADVTDTITTTHDAYLRPFATAIAHQVPFVMVSLATYERIDPSSIAAFSSTVMKGLLRTTLGFHGVIASDSLTAEAVKSVAPVDRATRFLRAGGDLIVVGTLAPAIAMAKGLATSAAADPAFAKVIDAAVRHVLRAKVTAGLVACAG